MMGWRWHDCELDQFVYTVYQQLYLNLYVHHAA